MPEFRQNIVDDLAASGTESWRTFRIMAEMVNALDELNSLKVNCISIFGSARSKPESQEYQDAEKLAGLLAKAVADHFGKHIVYINVLRNMSVDCDCAGTSAHEPTIKDIGILASSDLLAIDQAACDLVFASADGADLRERIQSRHGLRQLSAMAEHKMGNPQYELITVN